MRAHAHRCAHTCAHMHEITFTKISAPCLQNPPHMPPQSLGAALQASGAADYLSGLLLQLTGADHPWMTIALLYFLCVLGTLVIPVVVLVVLMAPIGIALSLALDIQPYPVMMAIALAASASVASPVAIRPMCWSWGRAGTALAIFSSWGCR